MTFRHDRSKIVRNGFGHSVKPLYIRKRTIGEERYVKVGIVCTDCKEKKA